MTNRPVEPAADSAGLASATLSSILRDQTGEHHKRAERSEFQRLFVSGGLIRNGYVLWLQQMYRLNSELELLIGGAALTGPQSAVFPAGRHRSAQIVNDLAFFGATVDVLASVPSTERFCSQIRQWASSSPVSLLGVVYVLEGSTNGARYIARAVRKAYSLTDREGITSLDPYGDDQPAQWAAFKRDLDGAIGEDDLPALVAAAQRTFDAVGEIGSDVLATLDRQGQPRAAN